MTTQTDTVTTEEESSATDSENVPEFTESGDEQTDAAPNGEDENKEDYRKKHAESSREAKYLAESKKVIKDNTYLITLAKNNRPLAERIAREDFDTDLGSAVSQIEQYMEANGERPAGDGATLPQSKSEFDSWYAEAEADKAFSETTKDLGIDEWSDSHDKVIAEYSFLMEGKKKTPETVRKILKIAYKNVVGEIAKEIDKKKKAVAPATDSAKPSSEKSTVIAKTAPRRWGGPSTWYN